MERERVTNDALGYPVRGSQMTIDQALARGLRRQDAREFDTRFSQLNLTGLPKRFGAMAREIHNRLVNQVGAHRIVKMGTEKSRIVGLRSQPIVEAMKIS
jgi:hypothetical protein